MRDEEGRTREDMERTIEQLQAQLARFDRLRLVGEMAASLGHEVRNPLTTVRGFLQMLQERPECADMRDYFELMIDELERADSLITDFLSLARDKAAVWGPVDLNQLINTLYPLISAEALASDKNVGLDLQAIPMVYADAQEIKQLLLNLTRNGLEAMPRGGSLVIGAYATGGKVVMWVRDEGDGIAPELLPHLGRPFLSAKTTGTGLGLAICYRIAERHHAAIEVATGASGTTFSVLFDPLPPVAV